MRIGFGYDVHRLIQGRPLVLGGVRIDHPMGLEGHSDADVILHALADAVLGALALGDIGHHFPVGDPVWKDAPSERILSRVAALASERGFRVGNADVTLIAEQPKIAPHVPQMRSCIAKTLGVAVDHVSVKATTNERLGFEGREEGMAAHAVVLLEERR